MTQTTPVARIRPRERTAILQSLRAGVVPKIGLQHIQVGRKQEIAAVLRDLDLVRDGGAAIRFIIGRFGAGKSFFLNLASTVALEKGFLVARADITTDRRLHGSSGQARALLAELMKNLSSKAKPDGGALAGVIENWISSVVQEVTASGPGDDKVPAEIALRLKPLQDLVGGYDFATVLTRYFQGFESGDSSLQQNAIRWLRAEYDTRTDARRDLGVRAIIGDAELYDYLKLVARFSRIAGYAGLVVCIDEMVVLSHRLASSKARSSNYEAILRMVNDCLQGGVEGLTLMFGGTDECLEDRRRGLYSYEALATRLAPNAFAKGAIQDLSGACDSPSDPHARGSVRSTAPDQRRLRLRRPVKAPHTGRGVAGLHGVHGATTGRELLPDSARDHNALRGAHEHPRSRAVARLAARPRAG